MNFFFSLKSFSTGTREKRWGSDREGNTRRTDGHKQIEETQISFRTGVTRRLEVGVRSGTREKTTGPFHEGSWTPRTMRKRLFLTIIYDGAELVTDT